MDKFYLAVGEQISFSKTVGESDVYLFAGITGDFSPVHINQARMEKSAYGERIAHGALMVGYMSTASTLIIARAEAGGESPETAVSLGYDRVRFLGPVVLGDTITVTYTVDKIDIARRRSEAAIEVRNQRGDLVTVARHIMKWVAKTAAA